MQALLTTRCTNFSLSLVLLALVGCVVTPTEYEGEDAGYAIVALGLSQPSPFSGFRLHFRDVELQQDNFFHYYRSGSQGPNHNYESDVERGAVLALALKPSDYEIYNLHTGYATNIGYTDFTLEDDVAIPFTIRPGQVTYIGHLQIHPAHGKNIFGITIIAGAIIEAYDRMTRDLEIAEVIYPDTVGKEVTNSFDPEEFESLQAFNVE